MYNYESKLVDSSRMIADIITSEIGNEQIKFDEIFEIALRDNYPLSMRAARIIELCVSKQQTLIRPHIYNMLKAIETSKIDGVKRNFLKILSEIPLPLDENYQGHLVDLSFKLIEDNSESIAVRAFSIDILMKFSKTFPELKRELIPLLETIAEDSSKGLESKCKKLLKMISKY
jgi:hypothetical protein